MAMDFSHSIAVALLLLSTLLSSRKCHNQFNFNFTFYFHIRCVRLCFVCFHSDSHCRNCQSFLIIVRQCFFLVRVCAAHQVVGQQKDATIFSTTHDAVILVGDTEKFTLQLQ